MLQERIRQTLRHRPDLDQRKLSKMAQINESSISRYLKGFEELNFEAIFRIVKELYAEEEKEIMQEYVLTLKSKNARHALEYCVMNQLGEPCDQLLEDLLTSTNPVDKEWATLYHLVRQHQIKPFSTHELLKRVEVFNPKEVEMQILKTILKSYIYFELNAHEFLVLYARGLEEQIEALKSSFIKESFRVRFSLLMSYVTLYANELKKARYYCFIVIRQDYYEHVKARAYQYLGHSYLFSSYEKASKYLQYALSLHQSLDGKNQAYSTALTLSFLQSYWQIKQEFTFELKGAAEYSAYIYDLIQHGELKLAKETIEQIDVDTAPESIKGFYYYYIGLIHGQRDAFYRSVHAFKAVGDYFHCQLPLQELAKYKENKLVLQMLTTPKEGFSFEAKDKNPLYF